MTPLYECRKRGYQPARRSDLISPTAMPHFTQGDRQGIGRLGNGLGTRSHAFDAGPDGRRRQEPNLEPTPGKVEVAAAKAC